MGSLVPGAEGEGRLASGYGALDDSWATMEGEGLFTESRGLEPYYRGLLDRRYGVPGTPQDYVNPGSQSLVPLGRQAVMGETLGERAVVAESQMVDSTYSPQPEALGKAVNYQPERSLWRSDESFGERVTGFFRDNPLFTVAVVGLVGLVGYTLYKEG